MFAINSASAEQFDSFSDAARGIIDAPITVSSVPNASAVPNAGGGSRAKIGALAGGAAGGVVALIAIGVCFLLRRRRLRSPPWDHAILEDEAVVRAVMVEAPVGRTSKQHRRFLGPAFMRGSTGKPRRTVLEPPSDQNMETPRTSRVSEHSAPPPDYHSTADHETQHLPPSHSFPTSSFSSSFPSVLPPSQTHPQPPAMTININTVPNPDLAAFASAHRDIISESLEARLQNAGYRPALDPNSTSIEQWWEWFNVAPFEVQGLKWLYRQ